MNIVSCVREKNSQKYLETLLPQLQKISELVVILDDHSDDGTYEWLSKFVSLNANVHLIQQPEMTFNGGRDWNVLYKYVEQFNPDWLFCPDADELIEPGYESKLKDLIAESGKDILGWSFPFYYLWNDDKHYRNDGTYRNTRVIRLYRYNKDIRPPERATHSTAVPDNIDRRLVRIAPIRMWHYGYMLAKDRKAKYDFYTERDKDPLAAGAGGSNYNHLLEEKSDLPEIRSYDEWKSVLKPSSDLLDHAPIRVCLGSYFPDSAEVELSNLSSIAKGTVDELRISYLLDAEPLGVVKDILRQLKELIRPGGRIEVVATNFENLCEDFVNADAMKYELSHRFMQTPYKKPFKTVFFEHLLTSVLKEIGFEDYQIVPIPGFPYRLHGLAFNPGEDKWL